MICPVHCFQSIQNQYASALKVKLTFTIPYFYSHLNDILELTSTSLETDPTTAFPQRKSNNYPELNAMWHIVVNPRYFPDVSLGKGFS
jgi:hypothetical protein